jgi:hypothetical protein
MRPRTGIAAFVTVLSAAGVLAAATATGASAAPAGAGGRYLKPGDLLVSESYYTNDPNIVAGTTKGSGGNGVDTVYFLDTTGKACPNGVGLPEPGAALPTTSIAGTYTSAGLASNMCVLKGFPTALASKATDASDYPFGIWFASPTTLYVADEGAGDNAYANGSYTAAAASTTAGLQKWVYDASAGEWKLPTARSRSGRSPPPSAAAATRAPIRTSWSP